MTAGAPTREERMEFIERTALGPGPEAGTGRGGIPPGDGESGAGGERDLREDAALAAAEHLADGGILAHPTSTVYGLGAAAVPALDAEVARLKGRRPGRPLIRLAADAEVVRGRLPAGSWNGRVERLAKAFWPGALTLVLEDGTADGLAVRVDSHPVVRRVLALHGGLMSSTSLNRSGDPPVRTPEAARRILAAMPASRAPAMLLAAGPLPPSPPSTLVSLRGPRPRLLREGAVPADRLEACLGEGLDR